MRLFKPNVNKMRASKNINGLIALLYDKDYYIRNDAAKALGEIGNAKAIEPLIDALKDNKRSMRWAAANALEKFGASALKDLSVCLKNENSEVRKSIARLLGKINDKKSIEMLVSLLKDKTLKVAIAAAESLKELGDDRGDEWLYEYHSNRNNRKMESPISSQKKIRQKEVTYEDYLKYRMIAASETDGKGGQTEQMYYYLGRIHELIMINHNLSDSEATDVIRKFISN